MEDKNLDKLFQDQLTNLEVVPSKRTWNTIESKLKKKKRRVVPFWWFASGVAAMLLIGMLLFPLVTEDLNFIRKDSKIIITDGKENGIEKKEQFKEDSLFQNKKINENILVADKEVIKSDAKKIEKPNFKKKLVREKKGIKKILLADNFMVDSLDASRSKKKNINKNQQLFSREKDSVARTKTIEKTPLKINLNKFVKEEDSAFSINKLKKKWSISPVFAVLNSNSFSNSSPLNKSLSNSTKGRSSFSYGVQIEYQINTKWSVQSGIHLQEMSFVNNHVTAVSSISTSESPVAFNNGVSLSFDKTPTQSSDFTNSTILARVSLNGDLNQKYGYIEIPIEVKYNFLNIKNFKTQVVAGVSSLFLNKNEVNFSSQFVTNTGTASNLNDINFSGNLGFDFNYNFNTNWSVNLNPMLKAQLDTFSEDSNGFSPFNFGVYTGFKYSF